MNNRVKTTGTGKPSLAYVIFFLLNFLLAVVSLSLHFIDKTDDIVYVDALKLVNNYGGVVPARQELALRQRTYQANLDTLTSELRTWRDVLEKKNKVGSSVSVKELESLIASKTSELSQYSAFVQQQSTKLDQEVSAKVLAEINQYLKQYGQQKGYTIILAATNYGNIAYGDKSLDITDEVLAGLNEDYKRKRK